MGIGFKLLGRFLRKVLGRGKKATTKAQQQRLARHSRNELNNKTNLSNYLKNTIANDLAGKPLKKEDKQVLNAYEKIVEPAIKDPETKKIKSKSGNFIKATYWKKKKKCVVRMKRGVRDYTFNKVSILHWLALCDIGGKYMWDYFGQKYSTNPGHWVRKSAMNRKTTANYTRTKKFGEKYKGRYY